MGRHIKYGIKDTRELEDTIKKFYTNRNNEKSDVLFSKYSNIYKRANEEIDKRKEKGDSRFLDLLVCDLSELLANVAIIYEDHFPVAEKIIENSNKMENYTESKDYLSVVHYVSLTAAWNKKRGYKEGFEEHKLCFDKLVYQPESVRIKNSEEIDNAEHYERPLLKYPLECFK